MLEQYWYADIWTVASFSPRVPAAVHTEWMVVFSVSVIECKGWECLLGGRLNTFPDRRVTLWFGVPPYCAHTCLCARTLPPHLGLRSRPHKAEPPSVYTGCLSPLLPCKEYYRKKKIQPKTSFMSFCFWCRDAFTGENFCSSCADVNHSPLSLVTKRRKLPTFTHTNTWPFQLFLPSTPRWCCESYLIDQKSAVAPAATLKSYFSG